MDELTTERKERGGKPRQDADPRSHPRHWLNKPPALALYEGWSSHRWSAAHSSPHPCLCWGRLSAAALWAVDRLAAHQASFLSSEWSPKENKTVSLFLTSSPLSPALWAPPFRSRFIFAYNLQPKALEPSQRIALLYLPEETWRQAPLSSSRNLTVTARSQ